jgi:hypothetical protein
VQHYETEQRNSLRDTLGRGASGTCPLNASAATAYSTYGVESKNYEKSKQLDALRKGAIAEVEASKVRLKKKEEELATYTEKRKTLFEGLPQMGRAEAALEIFLQLKKIQRQKYFGGAMVGNDVEKLLRALDDLWAALRKVALDMDHEHAIASALEGAIAGKKRVSFVCLRVPGEKSKAVEKLIARVQPIWENFEVLHHLCRKVKLLTPQEVDTLCKAAVDGVDLYRKEYPKTHVELKLHIIEAHVPKFVRKWRCAGPFFEDAVEHYHAWDNQLNRRFCCLHGTNKAESKHMALAIMRRPDVQAAIVANHEKRKRPKSASTTEKEPEKRKRHKSASTTEKEPGKRKRSESAPRQS